MKKTRPLSRAASLYARLLKEEDESLGAGLDTGSKDGMEGDDLGGDEDTGSEEPPAPAAPAPAPPAQPAAPAGMIPVVTYMYDPAVAAQGDPNAGLTDPTPGATPAPVPGTMPEVPDKAVAQGPDEQEVLEAFRTWKKNKINEKANRLYEKIKEPLGCYMCNKQIDSGSLAGQSGLCQSCYEDEEDVQDYVRPAAVATSTNLVSEKAKILYKKIMKEGIEPSKQNLVNLVNKHGGSEWLAQLAYEVVDGTADLQYEPLEDGDMNIINDMVYDIRNGIGVQ